VPTGTPEAVIEPYADGEQTPSDIPAYLSVAAGYEILPNLRASVEYHFYDDKHAGMLNDRQKTLKHGTHEYLAGMEWDITKRLTVSGGFQKTNYGLSDDFQTDTSFSCDSYSLGFGARVNLTQAWSIDVAYFWTHYNKYTKETDSYNGTGLKGTDIYNRTNKVFGLSLNYKF
jgi:long-chain fatty acid transport protein